MRIRGMKATCWVAVVAVSPCAQPFASAQQNARVDGVIAAEPLPGGGTVLVPAGPTLALRLLGPAAGCVVTAKMNSARTALGVSKTGDPLLVSIVASAPRRWPGLDTVTISAVAPCTGDGSLIFARGGELLGLRIRPEVAANATVSTPLWVGLVGRGACETVLLRSDATGTPRETNTVTVQGTTTAVPGGGYAYDVAVPAVFERAGVTKLTVEPGKRCVGTPQTVTLLVRSLAPQAPPSPSPAPAVGTVTGVRLVSATAVTGTPVQIVIEGQGQACSSIVLFGDGIQGSQGTAFPISVSHVYARPGRFTITAKAAPAANGAPTNACVGAATALVDVMPAKVTIGGLSAPRTAMVGQVVTIMVTSAGPSCAGAHVEFGDGTRIGPGPVPWQVHHKYASPGDYTVSAVGTIQCEGRAQAVITVASKPAADVIDSLRRPRGPQPPMRRRNP